MTRISKKIIGWILGAFACIAVALGVIASHPQVKTASAADVSVTFSAATLGDTKDYADTYGTSIRFDTSSALGVQWSTNHNWVKASDWKSIADYTTVNGRTVTEINNATTHTQKITLMMQPYTAKTCSFLRLYIPAEIIPLGEIKAMGILDGWSFNNGSNNYTASATTFLRNGDTMVEASAYSAVTKLTASNITIGEASNIKPTDTRFVMDSYFVNIDIGQQVASEYDTMYDGCKAIRSSIYINGKSIEEWNAQKIAEDARFKDPALYTTFPQNSDLTVYPKHADVFIKPVCLWGTSTGFRLSILQELVADCETVTVTVGAGCTFAGKFMVAETKSKTVLTQEVVDITDKLTLLDNTNGGGETWKDDTNQYYIHTNNEKCWTKSPVGGCLNEFDPSNAGGGQIQMKYIYFNGTSVYDINKNDDGIYNSEHLNIINGSIYAPIFAGMSDELGSTLKLAVPKTFDGGKRESITIKKGFNIVENGVSYYTTNDVVFTNNNGTWTKEVKAIEKTTEVTGIKTYANRPDADGVNIKNENFVIFQLSNNDYAGVNQKSITDFSSLYGYIEIDGNVVSATPGEPYFNVWNIQDSIAFRFADVAALRNVPYITIKAGAKFPSYNTQYNGAPLTYYVTSEDITFVHDVPNDTWTVGEAPEEEKEISTEVSSISVVENGDPNMIKIFLSEHDYTGPKEVTGYAELKGYIQTNDIDVNFSNYDWLDILEDGSFALETESSLSHIKSVTIKAGARFPSYKSTTTFYVTSKDITFVKFNGTWVDESTIVNEIDVTAGLNFIDQGDTQREGTDTYLITTSVLAWTNIGKGTINQDYKEQLKYIYFNGESIADINAESDEAYGSKFETITGNADCAPIAVTYNKLNDTSSYLQIWVPTGYPTLGATAEQNHQSIEIKEGFTITDKGITYKVTQDVKWVNLNGKWVNANETFEAETVTIGNPRGDGGNKELFKVDITSESWDIKNNNYDFMYGNQYEEYRKRIFINGVSVYDINTNTDDSAYVYSTSPMTGNDDALFAHPILIETHAQNGDPNTITLWIHRDYISSLAEDTITVTLGEEFQYNYQNKETGINSISKFLQEDVSAEFNIFEVTVNGKTQRVAQNAYAAEPLLDVKPMEDGVVYNFANWCVANTNTVFNFNTPVMESVAVEAKYNELKATFIETDVLGIIHSSKINEDTWLAFELSKHDYQYAAENYSLRNGAISDISANNGFDFLINSGFMDKVIFKGTINLNDKSVVREASWRDVYNSYINHYTSYKEGTTEYANEGILLNLWAQYKLGIRLPVGNGVDEIVLQEGTCFPSYQYVSAEISQPTYYTVKQTTTYKYDSELRAFVKQAAVDVDMKMADGASVRVTGAEATSGIRFETKIATASVKALIDAMNAGVYKSVEFGTLIVPTADLMGGFFTREWLDSYKTYLDIPSSAGIKDGEAVFAVENADGYYSYFGSMVALKEKNYNRYFTGVGYVKLTDANGRETYIYADYTSTNSRSASFVANAAINDRSDTQTDEYKHQIVGNNNWSPYSSGEHTLLAKYVVWSKSLIEKTTLTDLANKDGTKTITPTTQKLAGPYVKLVYSTNVNVWGVFTYTDGTKTANEDFYLQAGTSEHKQYLDIFRSNGVGYKMNTANLSMTSIQFTNAELNPVSNGEVILYALYSENKTINTAKQEVYVSLGEEGKETITVGAHLALGGSLTYLAKAGIYEGVTSSYKGDVKISTKTSDFSNKNYTLGYEDGYYGSATSSHPSAGAVNLINNFDAGRQIQQSWYAKVGNNDGTKNNDYTRAYCYTGSDIGQYWPYNPVQAGDVVSNPSQIIDFEVNEEKNYIYVKARAMDWAKGYDASTNCANAVEGGVTTKSYMENYYRLNDDGTLVVNNSFIDWNGFTDMESCDYASIELPAVYPVHTLNYYVSYLYDDAWNGNNSTLTYDKTLTSWTKYPYIQNVSGIGTFDTEAQKGQSVQGKKLENWFAWANGSDENAFGMGMYIPNVMQFTSGRTADTAGSTSLAYECNRDALTNNVLLKKGLMSNMQAIELSYKSAYVTSTSYTAPGISVRMEAYKPIEYSYVICLGTVKDIRSKFQAIDASGKITNAGNGYEKVGLDAWARADKEWTTW